MPQSRFHWALAGALAAAAIALPPSAVAQATMNTPAASTLSKTDQQTLTALARANIAEIETGKLAVANGQSQQVKTFGQQMIDDHTKALNDLTQLAQAKGVTLPTEPDAKHKAMAARLAKLKGEPFDKLYLQQAGLNDHKQVLAKLKKTAAGAKDPDVKALAAKMQPTVEHHLHMASEAAGKDGKATAKH
jgi:putative membrane protein